MRTIRDDDWWVNTFAPLGPWKFNPMFPCWSKQINIASLIDHNKLSVSEYLIVNKINKGQRARARSSYLCSFVSMTTKWDQCKICSFLGLSTHFWSRRTGRTWTTLENNTRKQHCWPIDHFNNFNINCSFNWSENIHEIHISTTAFFTS